MQTNVNDVLTDLKKLSDETDVAIYELCKENDQVGKWFSIIKETANAIVKGTDASTRSSKSSLDPSTIPNLVSLVKRKQTTNEHRVSILLAQNQKDHVRHVNRTSRNSLRKIILSKKCSSNWEISKSESKNDSVKLNNITPPNSDSKEKNTGSEFKTPLEVPVSNKKGKKNSPIKEAQNATDDSHTTPIQSEVVNANSDVRTPLTRSKKKNTQNGEKLMSNQNKEVIVNGTSEKTPVNSKVKNQLAVTQIIKKTKKLKTSDDVSDLKPSMASTPLDQTIVLDADESDKSIKSNKTPQAHLKRKSSLQLTQENAKRTKAIISENATKHEESSLDYNSLKKAKNVKIASNISLHAKTSGILSQHNSTQNEKRILREIQKKEEIVNQNTKKIKSLRQIKIEENKKNRELKMEKAMQQRMKMEKEKEERLRCRTHSKQEVPLQKEVISKKILKKAQLQEERVDSSKKKVTASPKMKNLGCTNSVESLKDDTEDCKSANKKAPPKPVRTPAKNAKPTHHDSENNNSSNSGKLIDALSKTGKAIYSNTSTKNLAVTGNQLKPANATSTKTSVFNTTYVSTPIAKAENLTSTPAVKKANINDIKTPLPNNKHTSYMMTPHQSSFVSYDISEIKSDDSDEEEENNQKPIPSWASSIRLRNAVINQYYNPLDTAELFGNYYETPDLVSIMGVQKKQYHKRTSSAVWLNSPNRSILS